MKSYQFCAVIVMAIMVISRSVVSGQGTNKYSESEASKYLDKANHALAQWTNRVIHSDWNWLTNLTNENAEKKVYSLGFYRVFDG